MQPGARPEIARYGVAALVVLAAFAIAALLRSFDLEGFLFAIAVAVVVWLVGRGPGVLAIALSILVLHRFFLEPAHTGAVLTTYVYFAVFTGLAVLITALTETRHRAVSAIAEARDELERDVKERNVELERTNQQLRDEIAERKKVEAELRRYEEFLNEVQRLSRTASWVSPIPRDPEQVAGEDFRYVGLGQANLSWTWDIVHPDDRERVEKVVTAAIDERIGYELEHRIVFPDGSVRILHIRGHPVFDAFGTLTEYIGTSTDVTKRRAAEAELRRSEQRYRNIFESAGVAIVEEDFTGVKAVLDEIRAREGDVPRYLDEHPEIASQTLALVRVTDANRAAASLFGASSPEDFLNSVAGLTTPEIAAAWVVQLRAIAEGRKIVETEVILTTLQGEKVSALVTIVLPVEPSGYESVLVTVVDLTERNRAHEALHQAQATLAHATRVTALGELTASIAHEVNQPLAAIVNNANASLSLLTAGAPAELEDVRAALADITTDAERASAVVERVRALARRSPPKYGPLQLADVVRDVVILSARELATRRVTIRRHAIAPLPIVLGDRVQLQQVLLNLVVNGMDAMATVDEKERLLVISECPETLEGRPAATIRVQDRGVGLSSRDRDRLFEAFYTTKPNGMGMGLAISRSIIEAHGGRMGVEPNAGPGVTFAFTLPAAGG